MTVLLRGVFEKIVFNRTLQRWGAVAKALTPSDMGELRRHRQQARRLRRTLNQVIHKAEKQLTLPMIGNSSFQKPLGSDWGYRPEMWREELEVPGHASVETAAQFGNETKLFHDCDHSELILRQVRNTKEEDLAPFGASMEVFRFDGSFLSMVLELPESAVDGLTQAHLLRVEMIVELEKPLNIFARLNIKHGPNTEQVVRGLPDEGHRRVVEFDLAYSNLNEKRVERLWLDLIFEHPEMNQVIIRDVQISRRLRAEL